MGPYEILDVGMYSETEIPWYHVVKQTGVEHASVTDTAGEAHIGICQEYTDDVDVARDRVVRVRLEGVSRAVASAAIAIGAKVAATNDGRVATATAGQTVVGIARSEATTAGDWLNVHLVHGLEA